MKLKKTIVYMLLLTFLTPNAALLLGSNTNPDIPAPICDLRPAQK